MTDEANAGGENNTAAPDLNLVIPIANTATTEGGDDLTVTIDLAAIPQDARLELLKSAVRTSVTNRVNVAMVRNRAARAPFVAWAAYEAAIAADPLQTAVAKPEGDKPTGEAPAGARSDRQGQRSRCRLAQGRTALGWRRRAKAAAQER
jgi:hypothetical protein